MNQQLHLPLASHAQHVADYLHDLHPNPVEAAA
jgi:hypothetical protein